MTVDSPRALLDAAYKELQLEEGDLLSTKKPMSGLEVEPWVDKGEWLSLGERIGIERIFVTTQGPQHWSLEIGDWSLTNQGKSLLCCGPMPNRQFPMTNFPPAKLG